MSSVLAHPNTTPEPAAFAHPLLRILAEGFKVPPEALEPLAEEIAERKIDLAAVRQLVLRQKLVSPELFQQAVAQFFGLEFRPHLDDAELLPEFVQAVPIRYAKKFMFFPTHLAPEALWVAVENPELFEPVDDVGRRMGRPVRVVVSTHQAILALINRAYDRAGGGATDEVIEAIDTGGGDAAAALGLEEPEDLIDARDEEPIKRLLNNLLYLAAKSTASDVHIDATPSEVVIRFRIDGLLRTTTTLPKAIQRTLVNRIKIMSRLDIAQRALPQDGRTLIVIAGRRIDIRVSTLPTVHGEKAVLRLLYQDQALFSLPALGMPMPIYREMNRLIRQTGGMILVSGPTGSGKTTTLYAALAEIDRHSKNIMTIEDPVEYKIAGYVQTELNPKIGLTFANALRSILRQDPDVIMVGEMRDRETAVIATQAALTGHLVFSTVHTNNAPATVTRLVDMGIEPYLVSSTVMAVLAQRLVRRICERCRAPVEPDRTLLREMGFSERELAEWPVLYQGQGCAECQNTGMHGRQGLFELLVMTDPIKDILHKTNEANLIREVALANGMVSMRQYGIELVRQGITTPDELVQATRED
ncbi:MAG: Flp pilus assembly complex ATPase component TadA [Candidatus Lambdaproteobacteria bacterium]|nr:Flp pilus assembly complex ATPase component TadA [Candidatus Lambdaproteobacteria bacterium]